VSEPVWRCEDCGGAAKWTFIDEQVYYHCEDQCDGFMQIEMALDDESKCVYLDSDSKRERFGQVRDDRSQVSVTGAPTGAASSDLLWEGMDA